jgi:hypothetical protein
MSKMTKFGVLIWRTSPKSIIFFQYESRQPNTFRVPFFAEIAQIKPLQPLHLWHLGKLREPFFAEIAQINRLSAPLQRPFQRFFPGINQNEAQIKVISSSKTPIFVPKRTLN